MKLPRDVSGSKLAKLLRQHGDEPTRQTGSHLRLSCSREGRMHHVTVPLLRSITVGTLACIISDVAGNLEMDRDDLAEQMFG